MKKRFRFLVLVLSLTLGAFSFSADDNHKDSAEASSRSSRPSETKKKPVSLSEKLSACLTERPGTSSSSKPDADSSSNQPSGEALFTKYCASCHSAGGSQGPISDWKLAAQRAGTDMPPSGESIPDEELSILQDYLRSR
jgi:mono/diheme cytochrome c family protein